MARVHIDPIRKFAGEVFNNSAASKISFFCCCCFLFFLPLFFLFFFPSEIILSHFDSSVHMTCFYFYYLYNHMMFLVYNNFSPLYFLSSRYLSFNNYAVVTLLFHHSFNSYSCSFHFFFFPLCVSCTSISSPYIILSKLLVSTTR